MWFILTNKVVKMITKKQLKIFEVFAKEPFAEFTRAKIKQDSKEKSNNALFIAINQFKKEDLLIEKKVGRSRLFTLNLNSDSVIFYLALANKQRISPLIERALPELIREINSITPLYSLVIFGSYAANKQRKDSDLDIAVFIEAKDKRKQIEAAINSAQLKILLEIDAHIILKTEFIEMLINDEENLGKQIARKHLVVRNHQIFYDLIKEGIKHGFHL